MTLPNRILDCLKRPLFFESVTRVSALRTAPSICEQLSRLRQKRVVHVVLVFVLVTLILAVTIQIGLILGNESIILTSQPRMVGCRRHY